jgi:multiple sugar transport system substrate-binding protein
MEIQRATYEPLVEIFNQENPDIHIKIVALDSILESEASLNADSSLMTRKIVSVADTAAPFFPISTDDIKRGYLYDLKPLMETDPTFEWEDFYPRALAPLDGQTGTYQLPHTLSVPLLFYNKDLWQANAIPTPDPNWTWDDLVATAGQLARKQGDRGKIYGLVDGSQGSFALISTLNAAGVDIFNTPLEQMRLDTPEVGDMFTRLQQMADAGTFYIPTATEENEVSDYEEARNLIQQGRVGIWIPGLGTPRNSEPGFAIGVAPFPTTSLPFFFSGTSQSYIMSSGTQHPQEAWRWLSFLSHQEIRVPFATGTSLTQIPARISMARRAGYWSELDEETTAAVQTMLNRPAPPFPAVMSARFSLVLEALNRAMAETIRKDGTEDAAEIETALRSAQQVLEQGIARLPPTPPPATAEEPVVVALPSHSTVAVLDTAITTITFGILWFDDTDMRLISEAFNARYPDVIVNINPIDTAAGVPSFSDVTAENDCFVWFAPPSRSELGTTLDMKPLIDADNNFTLNDYAPALLDPFRKGDALYGLPYAVTFRVLVYNQSLFDAAGLEHPTIDWTLEEFREAARHLDSGGNSTTRTYGYASTIQTRDLFFFLDRFGVSLVHGEGETLTPAFTTPQVIEAITYYINLQHAFSPHERIYGYIPGSWDERTFELIQEGRVAMWLGTTLVSSLDNQESSFTRAVAPPPLGSSALTSGDIALRGVHISAHTEHPRACWDWITYLSSNVDILRGSYPARSSVVESPEFLNHAPQPGATEVFEGYQKALEHLPIAAATSEPGFDTYWLFRAIDRAMQGHDLEEELARAETLTKQFLACTRAGKEASTCAAQVDPTYQGYNVSPAE